MVYIKHLKSYTAKYSKPYSIFLNTKIKKLKKKLLQNINLDMKN